MIDWTEIAVGVVVASIGWLVVQWALHVEGHINAAADGFERIARLEAQLQDHLRWCHGKDDEGEAS